MPPIHVSEAALAAVAAFALNVLTALAIVVVGWIIAGWVDRLVRRGLGRLERLDATLRLLAASIARYAVLVFVAVAALAEVGVQTASLLAVLGAAGLAIGLALQGTLSNIAAGLMILFLRPFRVGDYIDAEGVAGTVQEIGLFMVELRTFDGVYLAVPNSSIWNRPIKNFTRLPTRRLDVVVGVSYGDDVDRAVEVLHGLMAEDGRVLPDPAPDILVSALADSGVTLTMICWTQAANYFPLLSDLRRAAKRRLEAEGFTIPVPQREVHLRRRTDAAAPAA